LSGGNEVEEGEDELAEELSRELEESMAAIDGKRTIIYDLLCD